MHIDRSLVLKATTALLGCYILYKLGLELWCVAYGLLM
jgi:hypothetical protein